ncbi:DNA polymerase III subunit alpha [Paenibacillus sp. HJGM_3]|uniref:DNA polymerase III subunit alpha n=1 Tax=Paenibacillus sp. HJGM_3 TaxID=3379816 RepID=UPI00385CB4A2
MSGFVHLHVHSEYSLLDGAARIEDLAAQAAKRGMKALALTDHGVMYGAIPFYRACLAHGIKPIIGCEVYMTPGSRLNKVSRQDNPTYHLILLAKNETGYRNLMRITSGAHLEGFYYKPRTDMEQLARYSEGLVCLSSCLGSEISQHLLHDRKEEARAAAERYRAIFGDDYYLELQDHGLIEQKKVLQAMQELSRETGIPLIVTNDVHYIDPADQAVQDVLICIGTGKTLEDAGRLKFHTDQLYLKSPEEMAKLFSYVPEALENTVRVADKCELQLEFGRSILPQYEPIPPQFGGQAAAYLESLCLEGLTARYADKPEWKAPGDAGAAYRRSLEERLRYELGVIGNMGFSDYFLIVWDFIRYAHEHGIVTGPGRGSSAGSLVAYVLRITDVDPIKYGLLFERFLNPERVTMPDIDIDFSDERRDEVIEYVVRKYGHEHVAQIITFGTMAAKAAVRDVGRVMNLPYGDVDRVAKLLPSYLGVTIEEALRTTPELKELCEKQSSAAELIEMAKKVEGMPRHASTHAAGVVISREPLTNYVPLQEGTEKVALTQYSMEHLEAIGLLKMDFLGLRYLSIIERTLSWIEQRHGIRLNFSRIRDDDPATYEMLSRGDTTGIFQLESSGMRRVLKELRPSEFEDIISVNALFRPGPMEFIPKYIQGKHGLAKVEYPHESLKPILGDTYGIIVYQEQIMQIASRMAGFSLGEADLLRRAVSKKKREVLDEQRAKFVQGSERVGYTQDESNRVYDMIVRFADYGFPRAHATAYGVLAFQTAYLKAHYPVEFMASLMASVMGNHRKVAEYADECRRMGIPVLAPDVNESGIQFTPVGRTGSADNPPAIRFGLAAIKNVGVQAMESIMKERKEKPYENLLDFCRRIDLRTCNKRVLESLIQAGAMDSLPGHRAQLIAILDETVEAAQKWKKEREDLQLHLFGFTEDVNWTLEYPDVRPFAPMQQLDFERELLGLYLTGHPLDTYEERLAELDPDQLHELAEYPDHAEVWVPAMVVSSKPIMTRKGKTMGFLELENRIARVEAVLFPEAWGKYSPFLNKGAALFVKAKLQHQDEDVKLLVDALYPLDAPDLARVVGAQRRAAAARGPGAGTPAPARGAGASAPPAAGGASRSAGRAAAPPRPAAAPARGEPPGARGAARADAPRARAGSPPVGAASAGAGAGRAAGAKAQRLYVKIAAGHETGAELTQLQGLLQEHGGFMPVVLFYEREQKLLALGDQYRVKPSPPLIHAIEAIMGEGTAKVK